MRLLTTIVPQQDRLTSTAARSSAAGAVVMPRVFTLALTFEDQPSLSSVVGVNVLTLQSKLASAEVSSNSLPVSDAPIS
jgi:hypothetical protein